MKRSPLVRIKSDGTGRGTVIFDAAGKEILGGDVVMGVLWSLQGPGPAKLLLELNPLRVALGVVAGPDTEGSPAANDGLPMPNPDPQGWVCDHCGEPGTNRVYLAPGDGECYRMIGELRVRGRVLCNRCCNIHGVPPAAVFTES